ncbi:T9SS type A sorting domain-containing protein, partial [candidate division WOR-3 bacterium]|nr:T9SS type A sorting domain-containing protein [candidate division WOR-3 bacterium]
EEIWHKYYDGNNWSAVENVSDDGVASAWADVAVDSLGRIHLVWMDYAAGGVMDSIEIFYSRFDSISWTPPVNASRIVGGSVAPRVAIDRDNNPRAVWEERKGGYKVYYTYYDGIDWVNPVLVDTDASFTPDISVDKDNRVHIVWKHKNGVNDIFYTVYNDTIPEFPPENASNTDSISLGPKVATNSEYVHLIWGESLGGTSPDANVEIYYSRRELSGIEERENNNNTFSLPSIVIKNLSFSFSLSNTSSVCISFYDVAGKKVKKVSLGLKDKGTHHCNLSFDLPSGIYFAVLKTGTQIYRGKFILLTPYKGGVR